jgi:hypothetical protein
MTTTDRSIIAGASPGPWLIDADRPDRVCNGQCGDPVRYHDGSCCDHRGAGCYIERHANCRSVVTDVEREEDAAFIARSRQAWPEALDRVELLEAKLRECIAIARDAIKDSQVLPSTMSWAVDEIERSAGL